MVRLYRWYRAIGVAGLAALALATSVGPAAAAGPHRVVPGETLTAIAQRYGTTVDALAAENHLADVNLIYAGEELIVPDGDGAAPAPAGQAPGQAYTIRPGDTLWDIAVRHGTSVEHLLALNPSIVDPNRIYAGQTLVTGGPAAAVGGGEAAPAPAPASRGPIADRLTHFAGAYGLDPLLLQALAWQESGWQQDVVSASNAYGVMQVLPETAAWLSQDVVGRELDVAGSVDDNIEAGAAYLSWLIARTGSTEMALAGYYQGLGSIQWVGVLPETKQYVANVLAIRAYIAAHGAPPPYYAQPPAS
ncbi:MAG: LysM peptidoglycan-binding domain-containing protein [Thermomicrobiaceae bacterium]|nr:LysM peptidoglycan-binding domain-containing protein [Thermomicrobiaceae bacterium]